MEISNRNNSLFGAGPSLPTRLVLFGLLSLVLMVLDHRMNHLQAMRSTLSVAVYPLQWAAQAPVRAWDWSAETFAERSTLLAENALLREQQLVIAARLQRVASLESENERLRSLLESSSRLQDRVLIGELIAIDLDPYKHQVLLNKGSNDAAYVGQPILDANGIMGQLIHVGPISANAMLITDPSHAIPIQFNRTGIRTTAVGTGDLRLLEIPYLPSNIDVRTGDLVVTSGLGGRFPAGYPVATVTRIDPNPSGSFARIYAEPLAQLDRIREVLLVWSGLSTDELDLEPEVASEPASETEPTVETPKNVESEQLE